MWKLSDKFFKSWQYVENGRVLVVIWPMGSGRWGWRMPAVKGGNAGVSSKETPRVLRLIRELIGNTYFRTATDGWSGPTIWEKFSDNIELAVFARLLDVATGRK